jgi:hypothetical protein
MGTRANIARKNKDGSFDVIYTHWDGYPEHHAPILLEHYCTNTRVAMLLELGSLSILAEKIGEKHAFDTPMEGVCLAYGRDRGETKTEATHYRTAAALSKMLKEAWMEWLYVWDVEAQQWTYTNNPSPTWFKCCGVTQLKERLLSQWQEHAKKQEVA